MVHLLRMPEDVFKEHPALSASLEGSLLTLLCQTSRAKSFTLRFTFETLVSNIPR